MTENKAIKPGLKVLKAKVSSAGMAAVDKRSKGYRALLEWRQQLVTDLGGVENLSAQRLALVESCCRLQFFLAHVDGRLMSMELVNKRKKSLYHIVMQRQQLADALQRALVTLGLDRQQAPPKSLAQYLSERTAAPTPVPQETDAGDDAELDEEQQEDGL
jgi:hypothetical protein